MSLSDHFDTDWTSVPGFLLLVLGSIALTEALLQIDIIGGELPFLEGWIGGLVTIGAGILLIHKGATRAARYIKDIALGIWGR